MSNYTKTTNFATKDALASGNPAKIVKGTEIDTEFNNIAVASSTKANKASPVFTGTATLPVTNASSLSIGGDGVTVTGIKDEDDMASNSATKLASQQSIKAYVDSQVTAQDLDVTDGTNTIAIDLDSEALSLLGGTGVTSTASGNGVTMAIDGTVATLSGSQTLTNKTLATPAVTGALTTDGTIDGRDVAADGTKLDTVETNADVTDTTNVTAAGALMDSEVTNLAQVKAFDSTDYATAAQGTTADAALPKAGGAMTGAITTNSTFDGRDVATDGTKLDGIEALADVTDVTNVTAAGALMDSELTSIASVKALDQGVATTDSPTFVGINSAAFSIKNAAGDENIAVFTEDTDVKLYYNNQVRLATTLTGNYLAGTTILDGLQVDGDIAANGGIALGDNDKATFGAGDDLQIYHDGTDSYISEVGAGGLVVQARDAITFEDGTSGDNYLYMQRNSKVELYHSGNPKLATTSTGIDVTGTATMDGLTVDGNGSLKTGAGAILTVGTTNPSASAGQVVGQITFDNADISGNKANAEIRGMAHDAFGRTNIDFRTGDSGTLKTRALVSWNGDISFYEDTGTTPKFFWDASAESLGIGTSSPNNTTQIKTPINGGGLTLQRDSVTEGDYSQLSFVPSTADNAAPRGWIRGHRGSASTNTYLTFGTDNTERMRIDSSGNLLIQNSDARLRGGNTAGRFIISNSDTTSYITANGSANASPNTLSLITNTEIIMNTGASYAESMRIDASGNLLVGKTATTFSVEGIVIAPDVLLATRDGGTAIRANRLTSDGTIMDFSKDGTPVGSIGTNGGQLTVGNGNSGLRFHNTANLIHPVTAAGNSADNSIDLGNSTNRFKDLYLSGGAASGTSSNFLRFLHDGNNGIIDNTAGSLVFRRSGFAESMRLDTLGNLLVGTTSTAPATNNVEGIVLRNEGHINVSRAGGVVGYFNRKTDDGTILDFRKDGTAVGSIGSSGGDLYLGNAATGLYFNDSNATIHSYNTTTLSGGSTDGTIDLGASGVRFKNLYLSSGVYLGGTGAANKLEDYEEGTWTPEYISSTNAANNVDNSIVGYYTKIGNTVYVTATLTGNDLSGITSTDAVRITGLPFTSSNTGISNGHAVTVGQYRHLLTTNHTLFIPKNTSYIGVTTDGFSAATYANLFQYLNSTATSIKLSAVYQV